MNVPNVIRKDYQFLDLDSDGFLSLMDANGETKDDLKNPDDEIGAEITRKANAGDAFDVTIMAAMGEEKPVGVKPLKD